MVFVFIIFVICLIIFLNDYISFKDEVKKELALLKCRTDLNFNNEDELLDDNNSETDITSDNLLVPDMNKLKQLEQYNEDVEQTVDTEFDFEENEEDIYTEYTEKNENYHAETEAYEEIKNNEFNIEKVFLGNIFNKIGAVSVILALCYFLSKIYFTPFMQVALGYFAAVTMFVISVFIKDKDTRYKNYAGVLMGISLASMFVVTYFGTLAVDIIPQTFGSFLGIFLLIVAYLSAFLFDSSALIVIGLLGGYLTPFVISGFNVEINSLALYFIFMNLVSAIYVYKNPDRAKINIFNVLISSFILMCFAFNYHLNIIYPIILWSVYFVSELIFSFRDEKYSNDLLSIVNFISLCVLTFDINDIKKSALIILPSGILYFAAKYFISGKNIKLEAIYSHLFTASVFLSVITGFEEIPRIVLLVLCALFMVFINNENSDKYKYWIYTYLSFALIYISLYDDEIFKIVSTFCVILALLAINRFIKTEKYANIISAYVLASVIFSALYSDSMMRIIICEASAFFFMLTRNLFKSDTIRDIFKTNYGAVYFTAGLLFITAYNDVFYNIEPDLFRVYVLSFLALIIILTAKFSKSDNYIKYGISYVFASFAVLLFVKEIFFVRDLQNYVPFFNYRTGVFLAPVGAALISAGLIKRNMPAAYNYLRFLAISGLYVFISIEANLIITKEQGVIELVDDMANFIRCMTLSMIGFVYALNMLKLSKMTKFELFEYASITIYVLSMITVIIGSKFNVCDYFIPIINIRFIAFMFALAITYIYSKHYNSTALKYFMTALGTILVYLETNDYLLKISCDYWAITSAMVILYSVILIFIGIINNSEILKKSGIIITILALLKLLLLDLINLDTTIKVIIFLITGIILLVVSYFYIRYNRKK